MDRKDNLLAGMLTLAMLVLLNWHVIAGLVLGGMLLIVVVVRRWRRYR